MKGRLLAMALWICAPSAGFAQASVESCPICVLGIYDAEDLRSNCGTFTGFQKRLYLGIKYDASAGYDGATGIEFSILGLPPTLIEPTFTIRNDGTKVGDFIMTPADTTDPSATGGWNVAWVDCQPGNQVFLDITLVSFDPIPDDTVIRVLRKFPSTNPMAQSTLFTQCNPPFFTATTVRGDCYVLNPSEQTLVAQQVGDPPCYLGACMTAVEANAWSHIKQLFR